MMPGGMGSLLTTEQRTQIVAECVEELVSPTELARKWNCNADTIRTWVRKAGKVLPNQYKKSPHSDMVTSPAVCAQVSSTGGMAELSGGMGGPLVGMGGPPSGMSGPPGGRDEPPGPNQVSKKILGKHAICRGCGFRSEDVTICLRCRRKMPDDVKLVDDLTFKPMSDFTEEIKASKKAMRLARLPGKNRKRRRTMNPDEPDFNPLGGDEEGKDEDNSRSSLAEISSEIRGPEDTAGDNPDKELALKFLGIGKQNPTYATFLDIYKQYNKCQGKKIDPFKAEDCVHDMFALGLLDHQDLLEDMKRNWDETITAQDWMNHFSRLYECPLDIFLNFEECIEVLKYKIKSDKETMTKDEGSIVEESIIDGSITGPICSLVCSSIRIGNYKVCRPKEKFFITSRGVQCEVPSILPPGDTITISIPMGYVLKVLVHFGKSLPLIFLYVSQELCAKIRMQLKMVNNQAFFLEVESLDETQKGITVLPRWLTEEYKAIMKKHFGSKLQELESKDAKEILDRSSPKDIAILRANMGDQGTPA